MKTATKIIAATITLASLAAASVVLAHPGQGMGQGRGPGMGMMGHQGMGQGQGMGPGHGMGMMGQGMAGRMHGPQSAANAAAHLGELKAQLKLSAAQEPAWQKFEAFARQQAETGQATRTRMQALMHDPKAAPADQAAQREAMGKLRETHLAQRDAARQELYAALTSEQKAIAEQHMSAGRGHRMAMQAPAK